jgi:hypothetical protein
MTKDDGFDVQDYGIPEPPIAERRVGSVPKKISKRREQFVMLPLGWVERLSGASGKAWHLAALLLYRDWKSRGTPFKLANGMLSIDGVSRRTKWRALSELERRGLINVERRPRRSPIIRVLR